MLPARKANSFHPSSAYTKTFIMIDALLVVTLRPRADFLFMNREFKR